MSQGFGDEGETGTVELTADLEALTYTRFAVEVVEGEDTGLRVESEGEELAIGSGHGNTLELGDRAASRHHCTITSSSRGFLLRDLNSTNGIRLGRNKVLVAYLKHGDIFRVGRSKLRFDSLDEAVVAPISPQSNFGAVLGQSAAMRKIFAMLPRFAKSGSTVLIEGETGTGKTLLASAIHEASPRAEGPFIVVDCAAMTPTLVESQLFGHIRGAYTGASDTRSGAFVAARGGTVFLDEVGELPLTMQPKLLRVLEERVVTPLGETSAVPIDVRIIAATNRDLREQVNTGEFRADLFYRLHVISLRVPPLRERKGDIEALATHFWRACNADDTAQLPPDVLEAWRERRWRGNVRELRSAIERLLLLGDLVKATEMGGELTASSTTATSSPNSAAGASTPKLVTDVPFRAAKERVVAAFEHQFLTQLIEAHEGNITQAARAGHMDRNHLRELLRKHDLLKSR